MAHTTLLTDGSFDFSGGVNSQKVTTLQSSITPNGLARNELAWLVNGTVRDGTIRPRTGFLRIGMVDASGGLFQGGFLYEPTDDTPPYLILSIGGHIIKFDIETAKATDLSHATGLYNPPDVDQAFFCQGEEFLVIQAGDGVTLPLFYDGSTLRRSNGLSGTPKEIPAASAMTYYMGRLWYAQGRTYSAGDIVKGPSGDLVNYGGRDSILKVTENPLAIGGDNFSVPSNAGNIRALDYEVNLDAALGQGRLLIFTRKSIYALTVPVTRLDWVGADSNNHPLQVVVQRTNGAVSDRSVVTINSDKFYQSLEPAVRSYLTAVRYFNQWGNKSISSNEDRILRFNDRSLMRFSTGTEFDNRLLQAVLPQQTNVGVVHRALLPLDFEAISGLQQSQNNVATPVWEGHWEGLQKLQLFSGDFGGLQRCFSVCVSEVNGAIDLWELTNYALTDADDHRITMIAEFPAFTFGKEFELKELEGMEVWVDRVFGTVEMQAEYRTDGDPCWHLWQRTEFCVARSCEEDVNTPCAYPTEPLREGYKFPIGFGKPHEVCSDIMKRPGDIGFQFQVRLTVKGWLRIRGVLLFAVPREQELYANLAVC